MSEYSSLKATIDANVKTNGNQEITGSIMNSVLNAMVDSLGAGYQFIGVATPTNPGTAQTPDYKCFYLATTPGTYTNLGRLVVADGEVALLKYDSSWTKEVTGIASADKLSQLGQEINESKTVIEIDGLNGNSRIVYPVKLDKNRKYIISIVNDWAVDSLTDGVVIFGITRVIGSSEETIYSISKGSEDSLLQGEHYISTPNIDVDGYNLGVRGNLGEKAKFVISDITDNGAKRIKMGESCLKGFFVQNGASFALSANSTYCASAFIKLKKDCIYSFSGFTKMGGSPAFAKFDLNKQFIETFSVIPTGTGYSPTRIWKYKATTDCYVMCSFHIDDLSTCEIAGDFDASFVTERANNGMENLYDKNKLKRFVFSYNNNGSYIEKINNTYGIVKVWVRKGDVLFINGLLQNAGASVKNAKFSGDGTFIEFFDYHISPYLYIADFDGYVLLSVHISNWDTLNIVKIFGDVNRDDDENVSDQSILSLVTDNLTGRFDFTKVGVYDYYSAFDELAATYRDLVKQTPIGTSSTPTGEWATKDSNTYPINRYTFKKYGTSPSRRIVIEGATHGDSQNRVGDVIYNNPDDGWYNNDGDSPQNILSIYFFLADFLRNPTKNDLYRNLYENYEIEFIPILNPWGVQNHSRGNGRGVDLARNFDWMWKEGYDPSRNLSNGTAPFSENESAAFRDFFNALTGVDFCLEMHSRGNILIPESATWLFVPQDSAMQTIANAFISNVLCNSYYGFNFGYMHVMEAEIANLANWVYKVKGVDAILLEAGQTYNSDIHTRNTKMINYWMTCFLAGIVEWWSAYKNGKVLI